MIPVSWCRWSFLAIIALQVIWFAWLFPSQTLPMPLVLGVMAMPLLILAWGVWQLQTRALVLGGFILLLHFSFAVAEVYARPDVRLLASAQITLIVIYFIALLAVRRAKHSA